MHTHFIQTFLEQYEQCKCEVNTDDPSLITFCDPMDATVKHICFDEAIIEVKSGSLNLDSALEFEADTTYYLTSKSNNQLLLISCTIVCAWHSYYC